MCGIAGYYGSVPPGIGERKLAVMGDLIAHRGPDGRGTWVNNAGNVGFAHRRLSIIDLTEGGAQPMRAANGTVITFNGEIYNYLELREELAGDWSFRSHSDTEVILAAYERWGDECVSHLRGMF